eukprot:g3206.t1
MVVVGSVSARWFHTRGAWPWGKSSVVRAVLVRPRQRGFHNPRFDEEAAAQQDREAAEEVIQFWFEELTVDDWFRQSHVLDDRIRQQFGALHGLQDTCLALVVILDQFSRCLYRGSASAYTCDSAARAAANTAILRGDDKTWPPGPKRWAFYLPFMHSDDLQDVTIE